MRALLKTLAIIAFLALASQTVRHAYMLWLEPRKSVLDKYDQPRKEEIAAAASLDELVRRYDPVRKQVDLAKEQRSKTREQPEYEQNEKEPYKSEGTLREAITEWETRSKEVHALRFYYLVGLIFSALGVLTYIKSNRWLGAALIIAGFSEFIYWTSPTFIGATREFDRLLANKLALSVVSFVLLLAAIWLLGIFSDKDESQSGR